MKPYSFSLDLARALAILGVVAIHVWYPIYSRPDFLSGISWWLADVINAAARIAVPWFILVSGALLIPRHPRQEWSDIIDRLRWRLGLPLIFWTIIYFIWDYRYYGRLTYPDQALRVFMTGSVFHLYFLVILFGLYLFLPLWRRLKVNLGLLAGSFLLGIGLYLLQFFVFKQKTIFNFFTLWVPYLGYFLAGPYLMSQSFKRTKAALILWLVSVGVTIGLGYLNLAWLKQGKMTFWGIGGTDYFTHWLAPNIVVMSLSGFYLVSHIKESENLLIKSAVKLIARLSLGIYLIHMLIINLADKYLGLYLDYGHTSLWWYGSYKFILVFFLSALVTWLWRKLLWRF